MTLEFNIINQKITSPNNNYYVVADSVNYLKIDFQFTQDWQDFGKLLTFRNGQQVITIELKDDSCIVPWEVIKTPSFIFSIIGMKDGIIITTDTMKVIVRASGDKDGCKPKPPTKEFYEGLAGGKENEVLFKNSDADYDYKWGTIKDVAYDDEHTFGEFVEEINEKLDDLDTEITDHIEDSDIHVISQEKEKWNNKERAYIEPNDDGEDCYTLCFTNDMDGD